MNLTISVDEELLRRAREHARIRGTSVQDLLRQYLKSLVGDLPAESVAEQLITLMRSEGGHSGGMKISREDAYEGRL
jgi:negative regulator of replication initiation